MIVAAAACGIDAVGFGPSVDLPDPDGLQKHHIVGKFGEQTDSRGHRSGQTAEMSARGNGSNQHVIVVDMGGHPDSVTQERSPAVPRRRVHGEHRDA